MRYTTTSQEIFETFSISKNHKKYLKIDENNKEIFNFTEKYSIPTSFFNSSEGWFCVCIYKREFYDKTFSGTFRATYKYTVSESILRIERETDVSKMI